MSKRSRVIFWSIVWLLFIGAVCLITSNNMPFTEEKHAWLLIEPGNCKDLEEHIKRFPEGTYANIARLSLSTKKKSQQVIWNPLISSLPFYVSSKDKFYKGSRYALEKQAKKEASDLCRFFPEDRFRLVSFSVKEKNSQCNQQFGSFECNGEFEALCNLEEKRILQLETCFILNK